jgi:hypothetical protein
MEQIALQHVLMGMLELEDCVSNVLHLAIRVKLRLLLAVLVMLGTHYIMEDVFYHVQVAM